MSGDVEKPEPFRPSLVSRYLELLGNGNTLGNATGFLVQDANGTYLVTNWHVLSGRRTDTKQPINAKTGAVPDTVVIRHLVDIGNGSADFEDREEPLVGDDGYALWFEHPVYGSKVDVGVLRLTNLDKVVPYRYDPAKPPHVEIGVGDDITVVGYPFGISADGLPIWTRASIATEYEVDYDGLPCFLVDARTRTGQSGSPVLFFRTGGYLDKYGGLVMQSMSADDVPTPGQPIVFGRRPKEPKYTEQFLGIYSGRVNEDSDIGMVWRPSVVTEIIAGAKLAQTYP